MWRPIGQGPGVVVVAFMRCDAGEVVKEVSSSNADWISYPSRRLSSDT